MNCQPCHGTGFINLDQVPEEIVASDDFHVVVEKWIEDNEEHDVAICGCCGDREGWYSDPGDHKEEDFGKTGPYAYNGGLPECW